MAEEEGHLREAWVHVSAWLQESLRSKPSVFIVVICAATLVSAVLSFVKWQFLLSPWGPIVLSGVVLLTVLISYFQEAGRRAELLAEVQSLRKATLDDFDNRWRAHDLKLEKMRQAILLERQHRELSEEVLGVKAGKNQFAPHLAAAAENAVQGIPKDIERILSERTAHFEDRLINLQRTMEGQVVFVNHDLDPAERALAVRFGGPTEQLLLRYFTATARFTRNAGAYAEYLLREARSRSRELLGQDVF